jgi:hypothetical protein
VEVCVGKGKVPVCAVSAYRGSRDVALHVLDRGARGGEWSTSSPGCLTPPGKNSATH